MQRQRIEVPPGRLAATADDEQRSAQEEAMRRRRERARQLLNSGEPVRLNSNGALGEPASHGRPSIVVPQGKMA